MKKYFIVPIIAAATLAGCSQQLGSEDRSLITSATQAAEEAKQQAMKAAEDARMAREEAARAAAEAKAASEKADRIFRTGSRK